MTKKSKKNSQKYDMQYNDDNITVLTTDRDKVRQSLHVYGRGRTLEGIIHAIRELFDNTSDEYLAMGADTFFRFDEGTKETIVSDNGRGMPQGKMRELCESMSSSGKYDNQGNNGYKTSIGQNGMGLKVCNFISEYFICISVRDGIKKTIRFEDGIFVSEEIEKAPKKEHGTTIIFKPCNKIIPQKEINKLTAKHIIEIIERRLYIVDSPMKVYFNHVKKNGKEVQKEFTGVPIEKYVSMLSDGVNEKIYKIDIPEVEDDPTYDFRGGLVSFQISGKIEETKFEGYANTLYTKQGGTHVNAVLEAVGDFFRKETIKRMSAKEIKDIKLERKDVTSSICGVVAIRLIDPKFGSGQTKDDFTSPVADDIIPFITKWLKNNISDKDMQRICNIVKINGKARVEARKVIKSTKAASAISKFSKNAISDYVRISRDSDSEHKEIYLVEGKSAGSSLKLARNADEHAYYPITGKTINYYTKNKAEIINSKLVKDLAQIYGIEPFSDDVPEEFNRINIATDADIDGADMGCALSVLHWLVFPGIVKAGMLYKVRFPLYKIDLSKPIYLIDNSELAFYITNEFLKKNRLYHNGEMFSKNKSVNFYESTIRYQDYVERLAKLNSSSNGVIELMGYCLYKYDDDFPKWEKEFAKLYPELQVYHDGDFINVEGLDQIDEQSHIIELNEYVKTGLRKLFRYFKNIGGKAYGYSVSPKGEKMSLYNIISKIEASIGKGNKHQFKGLGEMNAVDLYNTAFDRKNRNSYLITVDDVKHSEKVIDKLHGSDPSKRRQFYIERLKEFDITKIET